MDYLRQGGGWMLLGLAGDHAASWRELDSTMGTRFSRWTSSGQADLVADSAAKSHPELRHVMASIPDSFRLTATWLSFHNTVRPLPGVTILYNARNGQRTSSGPSPLVPLADGSGEHPYVWAREVEKGRFLFNGVCYGLGLGSNPSLSMAAQADSAVPRMYWMSLRWLAGDFRNGCTNPASARFDPEARIDDGSCSLSGLKPERPSSPFGIRLAGRRLRVEGMPAEGTRITLRDLRGALIWRRTLPAGAANLLLDASLRPGVYLLEARASGRSFFLRAAMP